ncbi:MAG TPA: FecR domain-containing protein, partial [Puia sp.]
QAGPVELHADPQQMTLPATTTASLQWSTLAVPPTLDYKITLSDGTEVRLNSQTTLRFPLGFQGPKREVYVQGQAWFKVSKDKLHPFIVHTPGTEVLVVGTQFDVNTYEEKEETALVEGAVILKHGSTEVAIKPGIMSVYTPGRGFSTSPFDPTELLSWMKGVYYFHNTPLKDLAKLITRWYNVEVQFMNPGLQGKTFSGQIVKGQPLQSFLDNLNLSEDMHGSLRDGKIIF